MSLELALTLAVLLYLALASLILRLAKYQRRPRVFYECEKLPDGRTVQRWYDAYGNMQEARLSYREEECPDA